MKFAKKIKSILVAFFCFILGFWFFFPWAALGEYVMTRVQTKGAENGVYISVIRSDQSGRWIPVFNFEGVEIQHEVGQLTISSLSVRLLPLSSLLNRSVTCSIETGDAQFKFFPQNESGWKQGNLRLSVSSGGADISDIKIEGDLNVEGALKFEGGGLRRGDVVLRVPTTLDGSLKMIAPMVSLESTTPGEWRMKKDAPAGN